MGDDGLFRQLKKALIERALGAELTHHLGYEKGDGAGRGMANSRNGYSGKTLKTGTGELTIEVPRDRNSSFEPVLVPKGETHFDGFDEKIISMYARGMPVREIQGHLEGVTDAVIEEVREWQNRPLDCVYPVVIFDALRVKIRDEGIVRNKAVYLALGISTGGEKDVLGIWIEQTEGAKFWLKVMNELKNRGVQDVLIAVVDGLKGFPDAIHTVFPQAQVQTCIVHMVRNSLDYCSYKDRKAVAADLKTIYWAETETMAQARLAEFAEKWGTKYPPIVQSWRRNWEQVIPFFAYPAEVRRVIYTTNAIESLHMTLRKIIKTRGSFPTDDAATKLLYLALRNVKKGWKRSTREWTAALNQFAIMFGDRLAASAR